MRENQNEMAWFTKALLLEDLDKMSKERQRRRVATSNVDAGQCVKEKVSCCVY